MEYRRQNSPMLIALGPSLMIAAAFGAVVLSASSVIAADDETDVNIVTGLDISDSLSAEQVRLQVLGVAAAIQSPEVLIAIEAGRNGRIGFAVFAWHHYRYALVDWVTITSKDDAQKVAHQLTNAIPLAVSAQTDGTVPPRGRYTDISSAIDHGALMLRECPLASDRALINIIGNGRDNVGSEAQAARDRAVGLHITVNGVVVSASADIQGYYRTQVVGGPGSFVVSTEGGDGIVDAFTRKFFREIAGDFRP